MTEAGLVLSFIHAMRCDVREKFLTLLLLSACRFPERWMSHVRCEWADSEMDGQTGVPFGGRDRVVRCADGGVHGVDGQDKSLHPPARSDRHI
mmetsp:Transcript_37028/g.105989  ORF Transcript_37028/g.105989 Transcript_37028/m.105989 type:complete len:93 (+) Transcript_37028:972-1250(+)